MIVNFNKKYRAEKTEAGSFQLLQYKEHTLYG